MREDWKPWFAIPLGPFGSRAVLRVTDRWYKGRTRLDLTVNLLDAALWFGILFTITRVWMGKNV